MYVVEMQQCVVYREVVPVICPDEVIEIAVLNEGRPVAFEMISGGRWQCANIRTSSI